MSPLEVKNIPINLWIKMYRINLTLHMQSTWLPGRVCSSIRGVVLGNQISLCVASCLLWRQQIKMAAELKDRTVHEKCFNSADTSKSDSCCLHIHLPPPGACLNCQHGMRRILQSSTGWTLRFTHSLQSWDARQVISVGFYILYERYYTHGAVVCKRRQYGVRTR